MKLCGNRPEGFGPSSTLSTPLPTSCFTDTILLPLPTFLSLLLLPALLLFSIHQQKSNYRPRKTQLRRKPPRSWAYTTTNTIYYVLLAAQVLMATLEIVRLSMIHYGIGLLPVVYVGLLLAGWGHCYNTSSLSEKFKVGSVKGWWFINAVVYIGGIAMNVVKVIGLTKEEDKREKMAGGANDGRGKYRIMDQITDVAVIAGVYAVLGALEIVLYVWNKRREDGEKALSVVSTESEAGVIASSHEQGRNSKMERWRGSEI